MDLQLLSAMIQIFGGLATIIVAIPTIYQLIKNMPILPIFSIKAKIREHIFSHLFSYPKVAMFFERVRNISEQIMLKVSWSDLTNAYLISSSLKLLFLVTLYGVLYVLVKRKENIIDIFAILVVYYSLYSVVLWLSFRIFAFSSLERIKKSPLTRLNNVKVLEKNSAGAYFIYSLSAFSLVILVLYTYLSDIFLIRNINILKNHPVLSSSIGLVAVLLLMVFSFSKRVDGIRRIFVGILISIPATLGLFFQLEVVILETSDVIKIGMLALSFVEFLVLTKLMVNLEARIYSLVWKLEISKEKYVLNLPAIIVSTKDGKTIVGILFDPLDEDHLILKEVLCYHAIPWEEISLITVCGDKLYRNTCSLNGTGQQKSRIQRFVKKLKGKLRRKSKS